MNVWPVIVRELRQQSRQRYTFLLRLAGAGVTLAVAAWIAVVSAWTPDQGGFLFLNLHIVLHLLIWLLIPFSVYDCISHERREGTLGLLFLTPLRAWEIVTAKALAHGLRSATLLLAVLPVTVIPFLLGGLSWQMATASALMNFSALCWALGAGMVASSGTRSGLRALVGAVVFAIVALILHVNLLDLSLNAFALGSGFRFSLFEDRLLYVAALEGIGPLSRGRGPMGGAGGVVSATALNALSAMLGLLVAVVFAAARVQRKWREEPPPQWVQDVQKTFCTPVLWQRHFKRWMRWKIQRNPVGWLEQRTWTGRLVTWTWFAVVISVYSAIFTDRNFFRNFSGMQLTLAWLMMGSIAASAAGSFRRERESGVLELLLVTPMSAAQIVQGRLRGLWGQFLPAVLVLLLIWLYFQSIFKKYDDLDSIGFFTVTFLTLPVIGLYFSLRTKTFLTAFLLTVLAGMVLPVFSERLLELAWWYIAYSGVPMGGTAALAFRPAAALLQLALAAWLWRAINWRLERRSFPLERTI